jgi:hypothetical protein
LGPRLASRDRLLRSEATESHPPFRLPEPSDKPIAFFDLHGERWLYKAEFDEARPWARAPVGSFPLNATPEGAYDMLGYSSGQWCADVYDYGPEIRIGQDPNAALRVVRGRAQVFMDYEVFKRRTGFLRRLFMGEARALVYQNTPGRSWSRFGQDERSGAMFRVASSVRPP